jgi:hypothetical protein
MESNKNKPYVYQILLFAVHFAIHYEQLKTLLIKKVAANPPSLK